MAVGAVSFVRRLLVVRAHRILGLTEAVQLGLGTAQHAARRVTVGPPLAPGQAGQQCHAFGHRADGVDVKAPLRHCLHHPLVEHQVASVAFRDQHTLCAVQPHLFAASEEALDLFVDAAHRQHIAMGVQ